MVHCVSWVAWVFGVGAVFELQLPGTQMWAHIRGFVVVSQLQAARVPGRHQCIDKLIHHLIRVEGRRCHTEALRT